MLLASYLKLENQCQEEKKNTLFSEIHPSCFQMAVRASIAWTHRLPPVPQVVSEKLVIRIASIKQ